MDNDSTQKNDVNNTSTQKTVRLKPLVKQPLVGTATESQSVKKVSTNSGAFPKVGTQTGRISSIATNTARVVRINSALKNNAGGATGPGTTMLDFKTSEVQTAVPGQNTPNPAKPAAAPKNVLNSLNLKPKVAEGSVVEPAAAAPAPADSDTQTAAIPKAPPPIKPNINLSAASAPAAAPADNTQTAAVPKPAAIKPVINLNSKPNIPAAAPAAAAPTVPATPITSTDSDDATVKIKRPVKPAPAAAAPAQTDNAPTVKLQAVAPAQAAPAPAQAAPASQTAAVPKISVPTPASAPAAAKPSAAPTVKFNLNNQSTQNDPPTVAFPAQNAAPAQAAPAPMKLNLKKDEEAKPAEPQDNDQKAKAVSENAPESAPEGAKKTAKKKKAAAGTPTAKSNKKAAPAAASAEMPAGFHFSVAFMTVIVLVAAATFCCIQYLNIYKPTVFGKYIQIPFMEQVGK